MGSINDIVVVNITRGTKIVSKIGFGIPLILGSNCDNFGNDLIRTYSNIDAVAEDFATTTREYKIANVLFSQAISPEYIKIGKVGTPVKKKVNIKVKSILPTTTYTVTINDTDYSYITDSSILVEGTQQQQTITFDSDLITDNVVDLQIDGVDMPSVSFITDHATTMQTIASQILTTFPQISECIVNGDILTLISAVNGQSVSISNVLVTGGISQASAYIVETVAPVADTTRDITADDIVIGLINSIEAGGEPITLFNNGDNFNIEANVAGADFSISTDMSGKLGLTTLDKFSTDPVIALQNIKEKDIDFYFVLSTSTAKDDILTLAAYIETQVMLFATDSIDSDITFDVTTDVLSILKGLKYDRTFLQYTSKADNFLSAAWVGCMAPKDPGSATWDFKQGTGIVADTYSDTIKNRILTKNGNVYTTVGGIDIFEKGTVVGGEWIDIMQGTDWITINIQANVYTMFINEDKVSYTTAGIASIASVILATLKTAIVLGILTSDVTPEVIVPKITEISTSDKSTRVLKNIKFTGTYAGAIQKVYINGTLTV